MYHELFDIATEIRELEREQKRIKNLLYYKKRKWILTAKHITGQNDVKIKPPWSVALAKVKIKPKNIIQIDSELRKTHDTTRNCQGNNRIGS